MPDWTGPVAHYILHDGLPGTARIAAIAVLGSGLARLYPPEHAELAMQVTAQGAVISEGAMLAEPIAGAFPQRKRLLRGLSSGVPGV